MASAAADLQKGLMMNSNVGIDGPSMLFFRDCLYLAPILPVSDEAAGCMKTVLVDQDRPTTTTTTNTTVPTSWIPLSSTTTTTTATTATTTTRTVVEIGRADFLASVFAACGCSDKYYSARHKCRHVCRPVLEWAGNLSRQMLRIQRVVKETAAKVDSKSDVIGGRRHDQVHQYYATHRGSLATVSFHMPRNIMDSTRTTTSDSDVCHPTSIAQKDDIPSDKKVMSHVRGASLQGTADYEYDDEEEEEVDPRQWTKRSTLLRRGMIVSLQSAGLEDTYYVSSAAGTKNISRRLVFRVVSGADAPEIIPIHAPPTTTETAADYREENDEREWRHFNFQSKTDGTNETWKIFFCRCGQDLSTRKVENLSAYLKEQSSETANRVVQVVQDSKDATHWVISGKITADQAAKAMKLSENGLRKYVDSNPTLTCAMPQWLNRLAAKSLPLSDPTNGELWYGWYTKKRQKTQQEEKEENKSGPRNAYISDFFIRLSKLYEQCEVDDGDNIRAWKFHKVAGRLQKIDFDISPDTPLSRIRLIGGFGSEVANMVHEIVVTGRLQRLEEMRKSKYLQSIRNVRAIWGVGRVTAIQLVRRGFTTIDEIREDLALPSSSSVLSDLLDWKAKIGVEIYEDILEDMTRVEVEAIQRIVQTHAEAIFPGCEIAVMGSYRRGKKALGDVDILIVHRHHPHHVPGTVMTALVNRLALNGHLAFHLTELPGLYQEVICEDGHVVATMDGTTPPMQAHHDFDKDKTVLRRSTKEASTIPKCGSCTYLSVFNSPTVSGRRRRVDFKLYPYSARAFASLYFTGGKYFNRSMRQFVKWELNWQLDDKGIKDRRTDTYIDFDPPLETEEDVFERLGLVYKAPPDRKFFDDVEPTEKD